MKTLTTSIFTLMFSVLLLIGCGKENKNTTQGTGGAAVTSVEEIAGAPDRRELVGRTVDINDTRVQAVVGNYVFWVGDARNQIPVVRQDKLNGPVNQHVKVGDSVRLGGVLQMTSNISDNDLIWDKVNEKERGEMSAANVYINADLVTIR